MRFRCVICWRSVSWNFGCADDVDIDLVRSVDQRVWTDPSRVGEISDGGICDDCWYHLGGEKLYVAEARWETNKEHQPWQ